MLFGVTEGNGRRRVAPLSPDDRRAALVEATVPLLKEFGSAVSTRQIADAAGVAEGTIFRAFPDKNALLVATVMHAMAPPDRASMQAEIDMDAELRARLTQVVELMTAGITALGRLLEVMRTLMGNPDTREEIGAQMDANRLRTIEAISTLLEPDRHRLRVSVPQAARIILIMIFSSAGIFDNSDALSSSEIVAVLLDGLLIPNEIPQPTTDTGDPEC
jgi:AcrR family transcriptional regulator